MISSDKNVIRKRMSFKQQNIGFYLLFLFVPIILLLLFSYYPALKLLQQSFFVDWNGLSAQTKLGIGNYTSLFSDPQTLETLENNGAHIIVMLVGLVISFYFAVVLNTNLKFKNFFKSLLFLPYILNGVAIAFMFNYMYDFQASPVNILLTSLGLGKYAIHFLSNGYSINFALAFIGFWRFAGCNIVIFYGALQSIPMQLYDAANMDGANFLQIIRYIIIPNMTRIFEIELFLGFNGALQVWFEPYIMTHGGPAGRSATFVTSTLDIAFKYSNFGKASAMGIMLLVLIMTIILIQRMVFTGENN